MTRNFNKIFTSIRIGAYIAGYNGFVKNCPIFIYQKTNLREGVFSFKGDSFIKLDTFFIASFPETLTTAIPLTPGGVEQATIAKTTSLQFLFFRC